MPFNVALKSRVGVSVGRGVGGGKNASGESLTRVPLVLTFRLVLMDHHIP